jgi:cytochrome b subunit of formate dehydrogenase
MAGAASILRFTCTERAVHWLTALAFFSMLGSGVLIGRSGGLHSLMYAWHLASAGVLVAGLVGLAAGGNRRALRGTARDLTRLQPGDREWLASVPQRLLDGAPEPPAARFNAGQKVNFILIGLLLAALFASGIQAVVVGPHHNLIFGVHKLATVGACILVGGHLFMALLNPATRPALSGMLTGDVDRDWAQSHHPLWVAAATPARETPSRSRPSDVARA